jgi:RNA polymerase sigma-70 factor (ECF subfamily)
MTIGNLTDEELMARFHETLDDAVFRELVARYCDRGMRFAARRMGNAGNAQDAVQETFIRIVRHSHRFDPGRRFAPWFFTILRNVCTDMSRKEIRMAEALGRYTTETEATGPDYGAVERASAIVGALSEGDARLIRLRFVGGLSFKELASTLHCSVEAAKKRCQRIVNRLRV